MIFSASDINFYNFLLFTIPGALTVWAFRFWTKSTKTGDFEYLALSSFWSIVLLAGYAKISTIEKLQSVLENPYAGAISMSIIGVIFASIAACVVNKIKNYKKL